MTREGAGFIPFCILVGIIGSATGCQNSTTDEPRPKPTPLIEENANMSITITNPQTKPEADAPLIPLIEDESKRWLVVKKVRADAKGAWATGDFDRDRNKISIGTRDVAAFSIDTSRIPINWDKLVVIGIDGSNSELRRRDYSVLHFEIGSHGDWVVREP